MKIYLKLESDSDNSYPSEELVIEEGISCLHISLTDSEREVSVDKMEFLKVLKALLDQ